MTLPSTLRLKSNKDLSKEKSQQLPSTLKLKKKETTFLDEAQENILEIPTHLARGYATGTISQAGNILDMIGLQAKETLPGEKAKRTREFEILDKMEKGQVPSYGEFMDLSDDEPVPRYSRLPTSSDTRSLLHELGYKEPKTTSGRYAHRVGEFLSPPFTGGFKAPVGAALAGQTLEEAGAEPWMQAVGEIATGLKLGKKSRPISSGSPEIQKELNRLKDLGFTDQDLTLARNSLENRGFLKKSSKYTTEAENKFKETYKNVNNNFNKIIEESFPGLTTEGPQAFKKSAGNLFDSLDNFAREVTIKRPKVFVQAADKAIEEMERSLASSPQKKEAINLINDAKNRANQRSIPFEVNEYTFNKGMKGIEDNVITLSDKVSEKEIGSVRYKDFTNKDRVILMLEVAPEFEGKGYSTVLMNEFLKRSRDKNGYVTGFTHAGQQYTGKMIGDVPQKGGHFQYHFDKPNEYESYNFAPDYLLRKFKPEEISTFEKNSERFIDRLTPANAPGDYYTNFYKELNAVGNWGNPKQREAAFGAVKDAIKETFRKQGPEGAKLAKSLEEANTAYMKYLSAEDVSGLINKASTEDGVNFKKLSTLMKNPDNFEILKKGLGENQARNLEKLAEITSEIGNFEKTIKGGLAKDLLSQGTLYGLTKAVLSGDLSTLKTMAGIQLTGMFATKLLTDPNYQNIALRMATAAKNNQWNIVYSLSKALDHKVNKEIKASKEDKRRQ